jgi:hypothetical protein
MPSIFLFDSPRDEFEEAEPIVFEDLQVWMSETTKWLIMVGKTLKKVTEAGWENFVCGSYLELDHPDVVTYDQAKAKLMELGVPIYLGGNKEIPGDETFAGICLEEDEFDYGKFDEQDYLEDSGDDEDTELVDLSLEKE